MITLSTKLRWTKDDDTQHSLRTEDGQRVALIHRNDDGTWRACDGVGFWVPATGFIAKVNAAKYAAEKKIGAVRT